MKKKMINLTSFVVQAITLIFFARFACLNQHELVGNTNFPIFSSWCNLANILYECKIHLVVPFKKCWFCHKVFLREDNVKSLFHAENKSRDEMIYHGSSRCIKVPFISVGYAVVQFTFLSIRFTETPMKTISFSFTSTN